LSLGYVHSCARRTDGTVWCWGGNNDGQLGDESFSESLVPVQAKGLVDAVQLGIGYSHGCAVRAGGSVVCWGRNDHGQLGTGEAGAAKASVVEVVGLSGVTSVAAGITHTCALRADGSIWCWGSNTFGQLGNGTTEDGLVPVEVKL
jgi:alpha-tubulin suppressor-like RCC1 family protein